MPHTHVHGKIDTDSIMTHKSLHTTDIPRKDIIR